MSEEEFAKQVDELAKNKLQRPKKLSTLSNRWLPEILLRRCEWNRHEAEVEELRILRHSDVVEFVASTIMNDTSRRKLCVHVKGAAEAARAGDSTKTHQDDAGTCVNGEVQQPGAVKAPEAGVNGADKSAGSAADGVCDVGGSGAAADTAEIRVEANQLPQFRLSQALWPLPRHVW